MEGKGSITIKKTKDDTYTVVVCKNGERHSYPADSPLLEEYRDFIQWQLKMMNEMNAGSIKLTVS